MKIFISWSGAKSQPVANKLAEWLNLFPNNIETWVSGENIDPGTRWNKELSSALETTDMGILCLTKENQLNPWICFEAGALSKRFDRSLVIPFLLDFDMSELEQPLKQFNGVKANKEGALKIIKAINAIDKKNNKSRESEKLFELIYPDLEESITKTAELDETKEVINESPEASEGRIFKLLESISNRLFEFENSRNLLSVDDARNAYLPIEYKKSLAEINTKLDKLKKFDTISEFIRQGDFLLDRDPTRAIILYDKALEVDEENEAALIGKAKAYRRKNEMQNAIKLLDQIIKSNPAAERAYYNRACYKNLAGNHDKSSILSDLKESINLYSNYSEYAITDTDFKNLHKNKEFLKVCKNSKKK